MKRSFILILVATLFATSSCSPSIRQGMDPFDPYDQDDSDGDDDDSGTGKDSDDPIKEDDNSDDNPGSTSQTIVVSFSGSSATVSGQGTIPVTCDGAFVTIGGSATAQEGLEIELKGSTTSGGVKIYNNAPQTVTLSGVSITSSKSSALNIQGKKKTNIILKGSSAFKDGSSYSTASGEDEKGCLFSEGQIILSGDGSLEVSSNYAHGIATDDYFRMMGGTLKVMGAVKDGIHANDYIRIDGGTLNIKCTGDGIDCDEGYVHIVDGNITIECGDDGISTAYEGTDSSISPYIAIDGGTINIKTSSEKGHGMTTDNQGDILINAGNITVSTTGAASKAIKSSNNITVKGGTLNLSTSGSAMYDSDEKDTSSSSCLKAANIITLCGGNITGKSTGAGGKGLAAYKLNVEDGAYILLQTSGSKYTYSSSLTSSPKGIRCSGDITINGGDVRVCAGISSLPSWMSSSTSTKGPGGNPPGGGGGGGGSSSSSNAEGMESKTNITINGGSVMVYAVDDAINSAYAYTMNGGRVFAWSTTNDGIDSNKTMTFNGGTTLAATSSTSAEVAIDLIERAYINMNGGVVAGIGGTNISTCSTSSKQLSKFISNVSSISAGKAFKICNPSGDELASFITPVAIKGYIFFSAPTLQSSGNKIYYGGSLSGGTSYLGGYWWEGATFNGSNSATFSASSSGQ